MTRFTMNKTWNSLYYTMDERSEIDRRYKSGDSVSALMKEFKCSGTFLLRNAKLFPGEKKRHGKSLYVDESVFSKQTQESSYWAGFLITDGSVDDNGVITLRLSIKDIDQIFAFKKFVKSEHKVCRKFVTRPNGKVFEQAYIRFTAKKMANDLVKYGISPRKTHTAEAIECNNRDFWRGVIDGDGHIRAGCEISPAKNAKYSRICLVGTHRLCEQFLEFCENNGIQNKVSIQRHYDSFQVHLMGSSVRYLTKILYKDSVYALPRKARIAQMIYDEIDD